VKHSTCTRRASSREGWEGQANGMALRGLAPIAGRCFVLSYVRAPAGPSAALLTLPPIDPATVDFRGRTWKSGLRSLSFAIRPLQLPLLVEEVGVDDLAGPAGVGFDPQIDDRPVGQLGGLPGVVEIIVLAVGEAAVEDDVLPGVERVWVDQDRRVMFGVEPPVADDDLVLTPANRQPIGDAGQDAVARRVAPQDEVVCGDVLVGDLGVRLHTCIPPHLL